MKTNDTVPMGINEQTPRADRAGVQNNHDNATLYTSAPSSSSTSTSTRSASAPEPSRREPDPANRPTPATPAVQATANQNHDPKALREWADRFEADPELPAGDCGTDPRERQSYIWALRLLANSIEMRQEVAAEIRAKEAEKQRFPEELSKGAQQSGRRAEDGVLYRIRQELLEEGLRAGDALTLEELEVKGVVYRANGCWYSAIEHVRELYLPAMRRAKLVAEICNNRANAQPRHTAPVVKPRSIKKVNLLDSTEPLTFPTACKLLRILQKATTPDIDKAYQRLIRKHHPAVCNTADTAAVEVANRRTCRISEALTIVRAEMRKRRREMK